MQAGRSPRHLCQLTRSKELACQVTQSWIQRVGTSCLLLVPSRAHVHRNTAPRASTRAQFVVVDAPPLFLFVTKGRMLYLRRARSDA